MEITAIANWNRAQKADIALITKALSTFFYIELKVKAQFECNGSKSKIKLTTLKRHNIGKFAIRWQF